MTRVIARVERPSIFDTKTIMLDLLHPADMKVAAAAEFDDPKVDKVFVSVVDETGAELDYGSFDKAEVFK